MILDIAISYKLMRSQQELCTQFSGSRNEFDKKQIPHIAFQISACTPERPSSRFTAIMGKYIIVRTSHLRIIGNAGHDRIAIPQ